MWLDHRAGGEEATERPSISSAATSLFMATVLTLSTYWYLAWLSGISLTQGIPTLREKD